MDEIAESMRRFSLLELSLRRLLLSDDAAFYQMGVPGFVALQDPLDYGQTHHSEPGTFDRVVKDDLRQGAEVLAIWAYHVAQLPGMMPRQPQPEK